MVLSVAVSRRRKLSKISLWVALLIADEDRGTARDKGMCCRQCNCAKTIKAKGMRGRVMRWLHKEREEKRVVDSSSSSSVKERRKKKEYYSGRQIINHGNWLQVQTIIDWRY